MTSQPGQQTIAMHILTNISRSRGNQVKESGLQPSFNVSIAVNLANDKNKLYKILDY